MGLGVGGGGKGDAEALEGECGSQLPGERVLLGKACVGQGEGAQGPLVLPQVHREGLSWAAGLFKSLRHGL